MVVRRYRYRVYITSGTNESAPVNQNSSGSLVTISNFSIRTDKDVKAFEGG